MNTRLCIATLALGLGLAAPGLASDVGYIYGRIETVDGTTYQGQLRWGTEESFWDDTFNATKRDNEHIDDIDDEQLQRRIRRGSGNNWNPFSDDDDLTHLFAIRFGDLKRIRVKGGDDLTVEFRNGDQLRLDGGSNDVGARITVVDPKLGRHTLKWNRIRTIEFLETPAKLSDKQGEPIYGTVKSGKHEFTGRIQWDNDECLTIDQLDGETEDGDVSVSFGEISAIRKYRRGAMVKLKSGSEMYVTGSNDVDDDNRGVVVNVPRVGSVKIGWEDFESLTLSDAPNSGLAYSDFALGRELAGTVVTRTGNLDGRIVFDLDESWDFEMLHGTNGDTEYLIPFRDIARIKPVGRHRADVELRMGLTIELEDSQDVTTRNDGLLVYTGAGKPRYVAWKDAKEVVFR